MQKDRRAHYPHSSHYPHYPINTLPVRSVLNRTKRRGSWFLDDYTINPYSGCSFNCLYCYTAGTKYGHHLAEKVSIKADALAILEKQLQLRARKGQQGIVVLSSATDPYLHFEAETTLTRGILQLLLHYRFPVHIITKSDLVIRDFDLLREIGREAILPSDLAGRLMHKVFITFSFSTLDPEVAQLFEPGAPDVSLRLNALEAAVQQGFHSGVSLMPLLPYITDTAESMQHLFRTFSEANASYIFPATLTLSGKERSDSKEQMLRAIARYYPQLLEKYQAFFARSTEMPAYYRNAFYRKTQELSQEYGLKNSLF